MEGAAAERGEPTRGMSRLLELQELDLSIDRLKARLAVLESQAEVRAIRGKAIEAETRLGQLRLSLDEVQKEQRRLEGDLDLLEQKIEGERKRLYDGSVANAKELQAIEHEVESLRGRRSRIEDVLLEQMERREQLEAELRASESETAAAREQLAGIEGSSARELAEVDRELEERTAVRRELGAEFDEDLLEMYEELRLQKKGVGAAALVDGICQGCHQKLSAVYLDRLRRADGVRRCEYCRRILVFG